MNIARDVNRFHLQAEDVFDKGSEFTRRINLRQNRATSEEAEFLLHQRVELNALTSDQLVAFIEQETSTAWCQEDRARE